MSGLMTDPEISVSADLAAKNSHPPINSAINKRWTNASGAWLGIGTSPGALLLGIGIAQRYNGSIPFVSIIFSFILMFVLLWYQGLLGLNPPIGEGHNLTKITTLYFSPWMQRVVAALIALGMIGWFGFNVGLGGAALSSLLNLPVWIGPLILGLPIFALSLCGLRSWNALAALTTIAVLLLVGSIVARIGAGGFPLTIYAAKPVDILLDAAVFIGYISVFSVRAPDFTAGLNSRKDLGISVLLLCIPLLFIAIAGAGLGQGSEANDLVAILEKSGGMAIGNLLIALSVIAPTFTTLYSGAPALHASIGIKKTPGMILITVIGLTLAILRFDLKLISWVIVLAALLPPLVVPLAIESTRRRRGRAPKVLPIWLWLPGALVSMGFTILDQPLAPLFGLLTAALVTILWYLLPLFSKAAHEY
jgi:purine-cytosine permease-like protein